MKKITFFLVITMLLPCLSKAEFSIGLPGAIGERGRTVDRKIAERPSLTQPDEPPLPAPIANFSGTPTIGVKPLDVQFTDQSNGSITTRFWQFGDGGTSTTQSPAHIYTTVGTYTVGLTVAGPGGSNTLSKANYIVVTTVATSTFQPIGYYGVASDGTYYIHKALVEVVGGEAPNVEYDPSWTLKVMTLMGEYYVYSSGISLNPIKKQSFCFYIGKDSFGNSRFLPHELVKINDSRLNMTDVVDNTIGGYNFWMLPVGGQLPLAPIADFSATPTSGTKPLSVQFSGKSTGSATAYFWQFGDGDTATTQSPAHTYTTVGTYTVSLIVTGPGGSNTATKVNFVVVVDLLPPVVPAPIADFSATPTSGTNPLAVQFTDSSTGSITTRFWQFGDGGTATIQSPAHTYATVGTYTVGLTVAGPGGSNTRLKVAEWTFSLK